MDSSRFDGLARRLATRRAALGSAGAGLAALTLGRVAAQDATPAASPAVSSAPVDVLYVQTFDAGTFVPKPGDGDVFELTLTGAHAHTTYFANRPARFVGTVPLEAFLDGRAFDPADPPNAALVVATDAGEDVLVVELTNPTYDAATTTVRYDARPLTGEADAGLAPLAARQRDQDLSAQFGAASLFIDQLACNPDYDGCNQDSDCCSGKCCLNLTACFGGICAG
jgi:hypothetical protein